MTALVTFDFHNTLAKCDEWFALEIRELPVRTLEVLSPGTFRSHSREWIVSSYRSLRREVMESGTEVEAVEGVLRIAERIGIELDSMQTTEAVAGLMREAARHARPIPGAVESLRAIAAAGITVGVISSAVYHPFLEWTLQDFGLADDLAFIISSASSGIYKSNPEIYRTAMRSVGAPASASIHVGDSARWDVWSAKQAGMRAVLFQNGNVDTLVDRPVETPPDHIVSSMGDVAPWVLSNLDKQT